MYLMFNVWLIKVLLIASGRVGYVIVINFGGFFFRINSFILAYLDGTLAVFTYNNTLAPAEYPETLASNMVF